jgi:hypothetical protein
MKLLMRKGDLLWLRCAAQTWPGFQDGMPWKCAAQAYYRLEALGLVTHVVKPNGMKNDFAVITAKGLRELKKRSEKNLRNLELYGATSPPPQTEWVT